MFKVPLLPWDVNPRKECLCNMISSCLAMLQYLWEFNGHFEWNVFLFLTSLSPPSVLRHDRRCLVNSVRWTLYCCCFLKNICFVPSRIFVYIIIAFSKLMCNFYASKQHCSLWRLNTILVNLYNLNCNH